MIIMIISRAVNGGSPRRRWAPGLEAVEGGLAGALVLSHKVGGMD